MPKAVNMSGDLVSTSKFLSFILRHQPSAIGLALNEEGWADVSELIKRANENGHKLTLEFLQEVVTTNNKKRFAFSSDGTRIRANQGHSVGIELGLSPTRPPNVLYHGTATRFLDSILQKGLIPGSRRHVHLSADIETAIEVGRRHGKAVVLIIDSSKMRQSGHEFYLSENGVWLTESVPTRFINGEAS